MKAKAGHSKNIPAIEQWLKKKPLDHFSRRIITPEDLREPVKTLLLGALQPEENLCWMIDVPPQGIYHPQCEGGWLRRDRDALRHLPLKFLNLVPHSPYFPGNPEYSHRLDFAIST